MSQTERVATLLSKIFAPNSLAAIPEGEQGYDPKIASKVAPNLSMIQPGDLILTKTPSSLYHILRTLTSEPYDHIAVVLNDKLVLHIGPGRVRTLSLVRLLEPKRSPIVLRPILSSEERDIFLSQCWSMVGDSYDLVRVFDFVLRLILLNWTPIKIPFKKTRINISSEHSKNRQWVCSDAVMNQLIKVNTKYKQFIINDMKHKHKHIMFNNLGSLTIKDFMTMTKESKDLFKIVELPLKSFLPCTLSDKLQQYIDMFNELTVTQKLLVMILIVYMFHTLCDCVNKIAIKSNL